MIGIILGVLGLVAVAAVGAMFAWYRIVDPSEAHLVVTPRERFVVSPDDKIATDGRKTYFAIPSSIPFFGRAIRVMDLTIKELVVQQETYEKGQARYSVRSSTKYRIKDVRQAANTYTSDEALKDMLIEVVRSGVREVTIKYDVNDARSKKQEMTEKIRESIQDDLDKWGLSLENFQLVDFRDTEDSKIISDISKRREVEIKSETREQNAEKEKKAAIKEAEADEASKKRQIERDRVIGEEEQKRDQMISEQKKIAEEKRYQVVKVQTIEQAKINKEEAKVRAEQEKEVAIIKAEEERDAEQVNKERKLLEGKGDREKAEEVAKAEAAPIKERGLAEAEVIKQKGFAEAEAKEKLQKALNQFGDSAIRALVAEKIVNKDKEIGIATAKALEKADVKLFSGGQADSQGFDLGKLIAAASIADESSGKALYNKLARPNDMGFGAIGMDAVNKTHKKQQNK